MEQGGSWNKRILFFLAIGFFPFSTRRFQEGLKCGVAPEIRKEGVLRNEGIVRESEFARSLEPANCVFGLPRHSVDGGHVKTIAAVRPINFFVGFKPGVDVERLSLTDLQQSEGVLNCWVARRILQQRALDLTRPLDVVQPYQNACQDSCCHLIGGVGFQVFPQLVTSPQKITLRTICQTQLTMYEFRVELLSSLKSGDTLRGEALRHVVKAGGIIG